MTDVAGSPSNVGIALLHYPVYDRNRQVVVTAVTNLDIHDIARAARTFGLGRYYLVTPVVEQQAMAERIRRHWVEGWGAEYNPKRKDALELVQVVPSLDFLLDRITKEKGRRPRLVVTGARGVPNAVSFPFMAETLRDPEQQFLLLFGTGWGMTQDVFARADYVLEPVKGPGEYNHLSVRSAVSIILDRLFGR